MHLSILAPCLNEALNIDELVRRTTSVMDLLPHSSELVLVDDGSVDDTTEVMRRCAARDGRVVACRHPRNLGIVSAWRTAVERARGELICVTDADLQYRPEDIPRLLAARASSGAEFAQGARRYEWPRRGSRYVLSRGFNELLNATFGMALPDNKSGFFLCRRAVLSDLLQHRGRYHAWQNLVMVAAWTRGYRSVSVPTVFEPRRRGVSFLADLPVRHALRSFTDLGVALHEYGRVRRA